MKKLTVLLSILLFTILSYGEEATTGVKEEQSIEQIIKPYVEKALKIGEEGLQKGGEFITKETPILIKQYLLFRGIKYLVYILISLIIMIILFKLTSKIETFTRESEIYNRASKFNRFQIGKNKYVDNSDICKSCLYFVGRSIGAGTFLLVLFCNILPLIKIIFMPKLYLLEHFINLF